MAKEFTDVGFNPVEFKKELDQYSLLLNSKDILGEREIQDLFKISPNLTAFIGVAAGINIGIANQIAYEFGLMGDFATDIVFGIREKAFCFVELEDGDPRSVLEKVGKKATKEWGKRFEHGFSQIVDWFCLLDGVKSTPRFQKSFGYGHIDFTGLILIGRNKGLDDDDFRRLRWRTHNVKVDSHSVVCMTYDDLFNTLKEVYDFSTAAFSVDSTLAVPTVQSTDAQESPQQPSTPKPSAEPKE